MNFCAAVAFKIYDFNNDGIISRQDLYKYLKAVLDPEDKAPKGTGDEEEEEVNKDVSIKFRVRFIVNLVFDDKRNCQRLNSTTLWIT